jgi:hypothetical protein
MKLKKLLKETKVWERKFGEPLPTLDSVMEKYQKEGGKGSGRKAKPGSAKDIDNKMSKAADDANAKMDAAEKEMERKAKEQAFKDMANEVNEKKHLEGPLSRYAGINVFGGKQLQLMSKSLRQTAFDLEKVAKKKDEQAFDDILQRITITVGVMRSFLNKPKRRM